MIVSIESDHDDVIAACAEYRQENLIDDWEERSLPIQKLTGASATRANLAQALGAEDVQFLTGSGHGLIDAFTAFRHERVLEVGQYAAAEAKGKIIHLLSCSTAEALGPDLVSSGAAAFIGYDVEFMFPLDAPEIFLECDAEIDRTLVEGGTVEDAYDAAVARFEERAEELMAGQQAYLAAMLDYNRSHLCAPTVDPKWGRRDARLKQPIVAARQGVRGTQPAPRR